MNKQPKPIYHCPTCYKKVTLKNKHLICKSCNTSYPLFLNKYPVLISNYHHFLSSSLIQITDYIEKLKKLKENHTFLLRNKKLTTCLDNDIKEYNNLTKLICQHITLEDFLPYYNSKSYKGYFDYKSYLIRDWSFSKESENELSKIIIPIKNEILNLSLQNKTVLIPGSGLNRLGFELSDVCKHIYSFEYSLPMLNAFDQITKTNKITEVINTKTTLSAKDFVKQYHINIEKYISSQKHKSFNNITHFIADGKNIPLPNKSVDVIISSYFTDVLSTEVFIEECCRVLKSGGTFIHFGPLDYHSENIDNHLSLEDIINLFKSYGFELNAPYKLIDVINSNEGANIKGYQNIFFSVTNTNLFKLTPETKLYYNKAINYTINGTIKNGNLDYNTKYSIQLSNIENFDNASTLFQILSVLENGMSIKTLFTKLNTEFNIDTNKEEEELLNLIKLLIRKKSLSVK